MSRNLRTTEYRLGVVEDFTLQWSNYFRYFSDAQIDLQVSPELEQEFLLVVRDLSRRLYRLTEVSHEVFDGGGKITRLLCEIRSLASLKELTDSAYDKLQIDWHEIYLSLNKARGKLLSRLSTKQIDAYRQSRGEAPVAAAQP